MADNELVLRFGTGDKEIEITLLSEQEKFGIIGVIAGKMLPGWVAIRVDELMNDDREFDVGALQKSQQCPYAVICLEPIILKGLRTGDTLSLLTVFHELGHLKLHIHKGMDTFIDYDGLSGQIEDEANEFAHNATIPQPVWTNFMDSFRNVNPFAIHKLIKELSDRFAVNPQILYGRYMHEKGLYRLKRVFETNIK